MAVQVLHNNNLNLIPELYYYIFAF